MARNGSGTYALPSSYNPVVTNTPITVLWANTTLSDIATALTQSISTTGVSQITANIPMWNFKITGLGAGTLATDAATLAQVQSQSVSWCGTAGGTANALTLTPTPAVTSIAAGQVYRFKSGASANTGATTIAISGLTAIAVQIQGFACVGNELMPNQWYEIVVDATATSCQINALGSKDGVKGPDIASASTINLDTNGGDFAHVTGVATVNTITLASGHEYETVFDGALTLTYNATTLPLPGGVSITTAAGDRAKWRGDGAGNTRCMWYTRASGTAIINSSALVLLATLTPTASATLDFLTTFSATYDNYLIIADGITVATDSQIGLRVANAGTADAGSKYFSVSDASSIATTTSATRHFLGTTVLAAGKGASFTIEIKNANDATNLKTITSRIMAQTAATPGYQNTYTDSAYDSANSISGIRLFFISGSNFGATGKIRVYGYANT